MDNVRQLFEHVLRDSDGEIDGIDLKLFEIVKTKYNFTSKIFVNPGGYIDPKTGRLVGGSAYHVKSYFAYFVLTCLV